MKKWNLIIDIEKCEDCNNCFLACKDEHVDNEWPDVTNSQPRHGHRWMNIMRKERGKFPLIDVAYRPTPCMHCDDAPCIAAAGPDKVLKRDDGIVLIHPQKAKGDKSILKSCPYGAVFWNEEVNIAQKCTFCAHLLDTGWKKPRCVQVCPTGALNIVKADETEMKKLIKSRNLETLSLEHKISPRVYYKNLHLFHTCFIAGSVAVQCEDIIDCASGAAVILRKEGAVLKETLTDHFGDYKFDGIEPDQKNLHLEISYKDFKIETISIDEINKSITLPDIVFA
ncbi:MAG: hypothetical protein MI862_01960 [Desulfobacterales bacterium]|nr:hypothetical protein [Desulfobacterales bacterium]